MGFKPNVTTQGTHSGDDTNTREKDSLPQAPRRKPACRQLDLGPQASRIGSQYIVTLATQSGTFCPSSASALTPRDYTRCLSGKPGEKSPHHSLTQSWYPEEAPLTSQAGAPTPRHSWTIVAPRTSAKGPHRDVYYTMESKQKMSALDLLSCPFKVEGAGSPSLHQRHASLSLKPWGGKSCTCQSFQTNPVSQPWQSLLLH